MLHSWKQTISAPWPAARRVSSRIRPRLYGLSPSRCSNWAAAIRTSRIAWSPLPAPDLSSDPPTLHAAHSGEDFRGDGPVDVGETEVTAAVTEGELLVVEAHEVEDRGVKVVDVHAVDDGVEPEFVGGAVDHS